MVKEPFSHRRNRCFCTKKVIYMYSIMFQIRNNQDLIIAHISLIHLYNLIIQQLKDAHKWLHFSEKGIMLAAKTLVICYIKRVKTNI